MVVAIGTPIVDYKLATANQAQLLAQFKKSPSYSQSVSYYQANIGSVSSVDDLLKNRQLLTVALSAFQLEGDINNTGIIKKLLTQDPSNSTSLANQLLDPRYKAFAQAFWSLSTDGGAQIQTATSINAVLAGYQTNQYEKWVSSTDNDPSVRQALYTQRTVQDAIDISSVGSLYATFQKSPAIAAAVSYYQSNIGNVTSVNGLISDPKLLNFALAATNIDPTTISTDTVRTLLTQDPTKATSLAQQDPQYLQFAQFFSSLNTDGGSSISTAGNVAAAVSSYQTNQFEQAVADNSTTANASIFGTAGASQIATVLADFQRNSGVAQGASYYQANIGRVQTAADLVGDPKLLDIALGAYGIDATKVSTDVITQLLTNSRTAPTSVQAAAATLLQSDPNVASFVAAFGSLSAQGGGGFADIGKLYTQFTQQSSVQNAVSHYQANIGSVTSVAALTGDSQLLGVALTAFGLDPSKVSASTVNTLLTETPAQQAADPLVTTDPRIAKFVAAFGSLNTDNGVQIQSQSSSNAIVAAYQQNLFAKTVATDPTTSATIFADGTSTTDRLAANYGASSGVSQPIADYTKYIGSVTSVAEFVGNSSVLNVALGAFNLDPASLSAANVSDLLSAAPSSISTALIQSNPDIASFVTAFSSLNSDSGIGASSAASVAAITGAYQANQLKQSIAAKTGEIIANPTLAKASVPVTNAASVNAVTTAYQNNQFEKALGSDIATATATSTNSTTGVVTKYTGLTIYQVLSNPTLKAVVQGALNLPSSTAGLPVDQQIQAMTRAGFDVSQLADPTSLSKVVTRFLANAGLNSSTNSDPSGLSALFSAGNSSDPVPLDLSFLVKNTTSADGSASGLDANTAALINLFA
ncbi:MAG: hypothetical protein JWL84_4647 [Rhodospirillales bacterium]|nr:hypothetical protein [Rhodospirillales bacterium]